MMTCTYTADTQSFQQSDCLQLQLDQRPSSVERVTSTALMYATVQGALCERDSDQKPAQQRSACRTKGMSGDALLVSLQASRLCGQVHTIAITD